MVRLKGPMMSMDASGTLGKTITFAKWKGRNYARKTVTPANPQSGGQTGMRAAIKFLSQIWNGLAAGPKASWEDRAEADKISTFNAFTSYNAKRWRNFNAPTDTYPEATTDTGSVSDTHTVVAGERSITVTLKTTTANDGWAIAVFRSLSGTFDTAWDNLVQIVPIDGTNDVTWVDTPLDPGAYYYDMRTITKDGQLSAEEGELTDTVV